MEQEKIEWPMLLLTRSIFVNCDVDYYEKASYQHLRGPIIGFAINDSALVIEVEWRAVVLPGEDRRWLRISPKDIRKATYAFRRSESGIYLEESGKLCIVHLTEDGDSSDDQHNFIPHRVEPPFDYESLPAS